MFEATLASITATALQLWPSAMSIVMTILSIGITHAIFARDVNSRIPVALKVCSVMIVSVLAICAVTWFVVELIIAFR